MLHGVAEHRGDDVGASGDREEHETEREVAPNQPERGDRGAPHHDRDHDREAEASDPTDPTRAHGADERAQGGCAEQQSEHAGAAVEVRLGEDREEDAGHPEHHGDDVDGERRLQHALALHVAQSREHGRHPDVALVDIGRDRQLRVHHEGGRQGRDVAHQVDPVGPGDADGGDDEPTQRGADDCGAVPHDLIERGGLREMLR